jgi:integrase
VARPELPVGTWGKVRTEQLGPNRFRARTRFRDYDGKTRDVEASGNTRPSAERALTVKLRDRTTPNDDEITRDTRIEALADLWLDHKAAEDTVTPQTLTSYISILRSRIRPALGSLRIREATVGRLDKFLRNLAQDHPDAAKSAKVVLSQMFGLAVRHGAIPVNPVRETGRLRKSRRKVVALTGEDLEAVREAIRVWQEPTPGKSGPRHTGDLADIVDIMLATGARIGEVLALRWADLDLSIERPTLTISGTLVSIKEQGVVRQDWTKSDAGYRRVVLPNFAVGMLLARKIAASENPNDAIFTTRRGTWLSPNNVRRQWRQARAEADLDWVVPHNFRKTVATLIDQEASTKSASAQLGHASEQVTRKHYIAKPALAPDNSEILEKLGSRGGSEGPPPRSGDAQRTA